MGLLVGRRAQTRAVTLDSVGVRPRGGAMAAGQPATPEQAMRFSAVWAALRLRSDLISTLPVDVFRKVGDAQVPAPGTRLFTRPAEGILWPEWMYATQMDLDRYGNDFGHIEARENGYPVQVEPWAAGEVTVRLNGRRIVKYRYDGRDYDPPEVWHERQYMPAGFRVGLSPLAYAAWTIGASLSAQEFGLSWYANGAHPSGTLKHTEAVNLEPKVLDTAKARFREAVRDRDLFVTGKEWEYTPATVDASSAQFLEALGAGAVDVARYIGVPARAIDAAVAGQSLTYSNLTMDQLGLLTNYLAPAVTRREWALTTNALPAPRFVKFNTDALLRMDPAGRTDVTAKQVDAWLLAPDEGRQLNNLPPLTDEQIAQLSLMHSIKATPPTKEQPS